MQTHEDRGNKAWDTGRQNAINSPFAQDYLTLGRHIRRPAGAAVPALVVLAQGLLARL